MGEHIPIIAIEVILVLGGTIAFGWWQLRDVRRAQAERRAKEAAAQAEARRTAGSATPQDGDDASPAGRP